MRTTFTDAEYHEIAASLEDYHRVFYTFFTLAAVWLVDDVPTAAINLGQGRPTMLIGRKFWNGLTHRERLFVICHECLHVLLKHGMRNGMDVKGATKYLVNVAQDITINEMIVDLFNFDRNDLRDWEKYCWIDTCFKVPILVKRNETFKYYLELLIKEEKIDQSTGPSVFDDHEDDDDDGDDLIIGDLADELDKQTLERIIEAFGKDTSPGTLGGTLSAVLSNKVKSSKVKFQHLIRRLKRTIMKMVSVERDSFGHHVRRFDDLLRRTPGVELPGIVERQHHLKDRLLTAVFMDVSGSCVSYFQTFEQVVTAFLREPKIFDLRMFTFDTRVVEVSFGDRIKIGGGTAFDIIERECQRLQADIGRYPDCVVIITDGYGTDVVPTMPGRWVWLLTDDGSKQYLPVGCRVHFIKDVTFDS